MKYQSLKEEKYHPFASAELAPKIVKVYQGRFV